MKLLLTSNGLANQSIADAFIGLIGKPVEESVVAFIPTAANVDEGDKGWLIDDLYNIKKQGFGSIDIVDISALPKEVWLPRLEAADALFFSGGNAPHLMYWLEKSGLADLLPDLLQSKVYAGISAGSIVAAKTLELSNKDKQLYYEKRFGYKASKALGLMNFNVRPHFNSPHFPNIRDDKLKEVAKEVSETIYAIDDDSAGMVVDGEIESISEGKWKKYN